MFLFLFVASISVFGSTVASAQDVPLNKWIKIKGISNNVESMLYSNGTLYIEGFNGYNYYTYRNNKLMEIGTMSNTQVIQNLDSWLVSDGVLYASGSSQSSGGLIEYKNGKWKTIYPGGNSNVYGLLAVKGALYAGFANASGFGGDVRVYKMGKWTRLAGPSIATMNGLIYVNNTLFAGASGIWNYRNGKWTQQLKHENILNFQFYNRTLYAKGVYEGIWIYKNYKWTLMKGSSNVDGSTMVNVNGTLYALASDTATVWTFKNGKWTPLNSSIDLNDVSTLQNVNGTLYAETSYGLFSYKNGMWNKIKGLPGANSSSSLLYVNGTLYAAINGEGLWMYKMKNN